MGSALNSRHTFGISLPIGNKMDIGIIWIGSLTEIKNEIPSNNRKSRHQVLDPLKSHQIKVIVHWVVLNTSPPRLKMDAWTSETGPQHLNYPPIDSMRLLILSTLCSAPSHSATTIARRFSLRIWKSAWNGSSLTAIPVVRFSGSGTTLFPFSSWLVIL